MEEEKAPTVSTRDWLAHNARDLAPLATLLALILFFSLAARGFFSLDTLMSVLRQTPTRAIVGTGLTFVLLCAEIDLAVAMIATFSACLMGVLYDWILKSHPAILSSGTDAASALGIAFLIIVPVVVGLVLGMAAGTLTVWSRLPSFIITLAMMEIAFGLASYITHSTQYRVPGILSKLANEGIPIGGHLELPYSFLAASAVMFAAFIVLGYTRFGRYVYMVGGNREAARLAG
ncbi:ABC transporter permease, partial [Candidatus Sumerlaeota bacterium]|nr:ABC transporter permease [Candidatus Sumerlaeota bacterium]